MTESGGMKMNSFFQSIPKFESEEGWWRWKNKMKNYLTRVELWHYIKDLDFRTVLLEKDKTSAFKYNHAKAFTAMRN